MGFEKGKPRHPNSGRKKGTPNKVTQSLMQIVEESGIDPFKRLLELTQSLDERIAVKACAEVCSYVYPKRKAIEHSFDPKMAEAVESVSNMNRQEQINLLETEIKRLKGEP